MEAVYRAQKERRNRITIQKRLRGNTTVDADEAYAKMNTTKSTADV